MYGCVSSMAYLSACWISLQMQLYLFCVTFFSFSSNVVEFVVCDELNIISGTAAFVWCDKFDFFLNAVVK